MKPARPHTGKQLAAARVMANVTQRELANRAGLHVNSVYYLERQPVITTGYSSGRVATAMAELGIVFFTSPSCGIRLGNKDECGCNTN